MTLAREPADITTCTRGAVAPIFAILVTSLFGVVALAVDVGEAYRMRSKLQSMADAAALAGSASLNISTAGVTSANAILNEALSRYSFASSLLTRTVSAQSNPDRITVELVYKSPTRFAGIVGMSTMDLRARATAEKNSPTTVLDVAMCIDATGSMQPTIDAVKNNAMSFFSNLNSAFTARSIEPFSAVRIRPIFFRDYGGNASTYSTASGGKVDKYPNGYVNRPAGDARNLGDDVPMRPAADFYNMVNQASAFNAFVSPEQESGGGDLAEAALECLNEAMGSMWMRVGQSVQTAKGSANATKVFSIVAMWTDADTHAPGFVHSLDNPNYPPPAKMPRDYGALLSKWRADATIPQDGKMLALFIQPSAPTTGWNQIKTWDGFVAAGTLRDGTTQMVDKLADAVSQIVNRGATTRLSR